MTDSTSDDERVEALFMAPGSVVHHMVEFNSGPDIGISVGLVDAALYAGEVPAKRKGWALVVYTGHERMDVADEVDPEEARDLIERIGRVIEAEREARGKAEADVIRAMNMVADWCVKAGDRLGEIVRLRGVLLTLAEGKGRCGTCGKLSEGEGGGIVSCPAYGPCVWEPIDPATYAREALEASHLRLSVAVQGAAAIPGSGEGVV